MEKAWYISSPCFAWSGRAEWGGAEKIWKKLRNRFDKLKKHAKLHFHCAWKSDDDCKEQVIFENWIVRWTREMILRSWKGLRSRSKKMRIEKICDKIESWRTKLVFRADRRIGHILFGEFDPGSERTLAAWIRHASRTKQQCLVAQGWGTREWLTRKFGTAPGNGN